MPLFGPPNIEKLKERRDIEGLTKAARYKQPDVRAKAVMALAESHDVRALEPLIAAIDDASLLHGVVYSALIAVVELGGGQSFVPLIRALRHRSWGVRADAARLLGRLRDDRALRPLIGALDDEESEVQVAAAEALGELGNPVASVPLIGALRSPLCRRKQAAIAALRKLRSPLAVEPLIEVVAAKTVDGRMSDTDRQDRVLAAHALGELGFLAVTPLMVALKQAEPEVKPYIVQALGLVGGPEAEQAVETLTAALKDEERGGIARPAAAKALGQLGDARAVKPLLAALKDNKWSWSSRLRETAAEALGKLGDARAVEPLIAALKDKELSVRLAAAGALGELGHAAAVEPLVAALERTSSPLCATVAEALGKLGDARAVEPLIALWHTILSYLGGDYTDALKATARALGALKDSRSVEPLIAALGRDYDDLAMQRASTEASGPTGPGRPQQEVLIRSSKFYYADIRRYAAEALGQLGDARAVETLIATLDDMYEHVRVAAAEGLERIGGPEAERALAEYRARQE